MSYERGMLEKLSMPAKQEVKDEIIRTLFRHNGSIKEFASGEVIVDEIAAQFSLSKEQRESVLERTYLKESRIVKTPLWHRLLYRAANELANAHLVTRPSDTIHLTGKKEWLITEKGIDLAIRLMKIPSAQEDKLPVQSYETQEEISRMKKQPRPEQYIPFDERQKNKITKKITRIRSRSFRQAIIEAYNFTCSVCGLKINSPDSLSWEVEAAHIVPHRLNGKDDIWNGIALCRLHHWAFDVGWFSFSNNYRMLISPQLRNVIGDFGNIGDMAVFRNSLVSDKRILLPDNASFYPHENSIEWHRKHTFCS